MIHDYLSQHCFFLVVLHANVVSVLLLMLLVDCVMVTAMILSPCFQPASLTDLAIRSHCVRAEEWLSK